MSFDKVICIGWYDGITSGLVLCADSVRAFRFDLIAWDDVQSRRIFALSPLEIAKFYEAANLLQEKSPIMWPMWHPTWPDREGNEAMYEQWDAILKSVGRTKYVFGSDALLKTTYAIKELTASELHLLPAVLPDFFTGEFKYMDFNYWARYLGMQAD